MDDYICMIDERLKFMNCQSKTEKKTKETCCVFLKVCRFWTACLPLFNGATVKHVDNRTIIHDFLTNMEDIRQLAFSMRINSKVCGA